MAAPAVRTLSRYLLRQHVAPLGFALAALTALMLVNTMAKQLSALLGKGLPTGVIVEVFVLSIPFIVAVTLPMAVLVAVLHVFTRLAADNEITAMQASGVSVTRLVAPVLGGAACVALLSFAWNDQVLPRSNHQLRILQVDIQRKKPSFTLKEQVINEVVAGQFFLRAARIDATANKLKDVTIYNLADPERRRVITADSGLMAYTPGGRDLYLTLQDGDIREVNRSDPTQFNRTFFITNRMRVAGARRPPPPPPRHPPPDAPAPAAPPPPPTTPPPPAPAASAPAAASGTAAAPLHAAPAPPVPPAPNGGADSPVDTPPRLHHCG